MNTEKYNKLHYQITIIFNWFPTFKLNINKALVGKLDIPTLPKNCQWKFKDRSTSNKYNENVY